MDENDGTQRNLINGNQNQQQDDQSKAMNDQNRQVNLVEDQCFKKQMEFKGGKLHQLISDQVLNSNQIYSNRYQGMIGVWYFFIDTVVHIENALVLFLFILTKINPDMIDQSFPITAVAVNLFLMGLRNSIFEMRQREINRKINNKKADLLFIARKFKKFIPITWSEIYPGQIIQLKNGHEFPCDCLLLNIQGNEEKCFVSAGPFEDLTGMMQKKSYSATSLKVSNQQKAENIADMISGILKFEYNYFGYVSGSFKLNENPSAIEFDTENVVSRGSVLINAEKVTCLVLNVGNQCIGSVFKDPQSAMENQTNQKLKSFVKTQRSFDKAYKQSVILFLTFLTFIYLVVSFLSIYLGSNNLIFNVGNFEKGVFPNNQNQQVYYVLNGIGFFGNLLSTIPVSFSNIIDLLVLVHTNFAEWDIDTTPADVFFIQPHATLAFGKVAHMFFSRKAIQSDDKQSVNLFYVSGQCYKNKIHHIKTDKDKQDDNKMDNSDILDQQNQNNQEGDYSSDDDLALDYLPNELKFSNQFQNIQLESIIKGPETPTKKQIFELFRAVCLCHQTNIIASTKQHEKNMNQYMSVYKDEIASLEFVNNQDFKLVKRKNKMLTLINQGQQERYEELGVITTKSVNGHNITISANRLQGQEAGTLYVKGSILSIKQFVQNNEEEYNLLNIYEQKFLQAGVHSMMYAKRQLTIDETSQLVIIINEGIQQTKENSKIESVLKSLVQTQLEILGILGLNRAVHLRNRVTVDDMILNGVKPWIISRCDENTHNTCLNSLRIFDYCHEPLIINGKQEKIVIDQIMNALKIVTDRMALKAQIKVMDESVHEFDTHSHATYTTAKRSQATSRQKRKKSKNFNNDLNKNFEQKLNNYRNVVVFTGDALQQIIRDLSLQKTFMTLAYLSDMMVGSEISPLQKQKLIKIAKQYVGEGEYAASIITMPEDQFMIYEADICVNLKTKGKAADFQAVVDVSLRDFSAVSYLLFKHGSSIQLRLSIAAQAFIYRSFIVFLIIVSYMYESGFTAIFPYTSFYYYFVTLFIIPAQVLIYSTFYKGVGNEFLYRIYGHYKYNFTYSLIQVEQVLMDILKTLFDWCIVYLIQELQYFIKTVNIINGGQLSNQGYNCYQEILLQFIFFFYFTNTSVHVITSFGLILGTTVVGVAIILNDPNLIGLQELFTSPALILTLLFQFLILNLRNFFIDVLQKFALQRNSQLNDFYADIEEKLSFEQYEDPEQQFTIQQYPPLYRQINASVLKNTLRLINLNMMKVPRNDQIEQIIDKINSEFSVEKRSLEYGGTGEQLFGKQTTQQGQDEQNDKQNLKNFGNQQLSGAINTWTLTLNDMNQETEYQDNKNNREIIYVRRQMLVFIIMTLIFSVIGIILYLTNSFTINGIYYFLGLCVLTIIVYYVFPNFPSYISNSLMVYTLIVIFCYDIYSTSDSSLQPTGLLFVLGLVACLNHSYLYPTIIIIIVSVLVFIFFSITNSTNSSTSSFENSFKTCTWFFAGVLWSSYVYLQELEKKLSFVSGHKKVRYYQRLKQILNILIPSIVRDKIRSGKKNFSDDEGVVTIIFVDIANFDQLVENYKGSDLIALLDQLYNAFDQLCDQYGLQKVETVGKTYVACGGLKTAEQKIEQRLLNRHHSVRVTDFAQDILQYVKTIYLKNGKHLEVNTGIHSGPVISGVVGETKPQFSLIGPTVNKTSRVCSLSQPMRCSISKEAKHFLELYTNNLQFTMTKVFMKGIGDEPIFTVTKSRVIKSSKASKFQNAQLKKNEGKNDKNQKDSKIKSQEQDKRKQAYSDNGSNEEGSNQDSGRGQDTNRVMINQFENQNMDQFENDDNQSEKSDQVDDDIMNVFGFNDDLNLDDRVIVQNPTENQIYNLVERPKYLLQFEQKDIELEFHHQISKSEKIRTSIYLILLIFLNKIIIINDIMQGDGRFVFGFQFYIMMPVFLMEIYLLYKINNPNLTDVYQRSLLLIAYEIYLLLLLLTFQIKYMGDFSRFFFIELLIQIVLSIFFFIRNTNTRYFILAYSIFLISWVIAIAATTKLLYYQIIQSILSQILYFLLLSVGIHHRETIQRKTVNYERILNIETNKTNQLISKLIPLHMVAVIKNQKRHVDEFDDCTLLFTDMVKFTAFSQNAKDPREVVQLVSKLFSKFDQLCDLHNVYKVHTIGDCYVIMGYNGKIDKNKRNHQVVLDETYRVILAGLDMINVIIEVRETSDNINVRELDMRIGIHTGRVIAGIIGSKVVRYDIFGEGVLIANKMESNGIPGKVCISQDSKKIIMKSQEITRQFIFTSHEVVQLPKINKSIQSFIVEKRQDSFRSLSDSADSSSDDDSSEDYSSKDQKNKSEASQSINSKK